MIFDYELIDCGQGVRIERFGDRIIKRPCPQAETWSLKNKAVRTDLVFQRGSGWHNPSQIDEAWPIKVGSVTAHLKLSSQGQIGIFPEQFDNWQWIDKTITAHTNRPIKILNTFAYTGMSTLFASQSHTEVCHVDGAKSALAWAKQNALSSGKQENAIRWICDDVISFMAREIRRQQHYDAIILDPPAFGRGAKKDFKIERDLPTLLDLINQLLSPNPRFVILTCHAPDLFTATDFKQKLEALPAFKGRKAEALNLTIPSKNGNPLPSSFGARISF